MLDGYEKGSSFDSGTWGHQEFDQGSQQRLTTLPKVMNDLKAHIIIYEILNI